MLVQQSKSQGQNVVMSVYSLPVPYSNAESPDPNTEPSAHWPISPDLLSLFVLRIYSFPAHSTAPQLPSVSHEFDSVQLKQIQHLKLLQISEMHHEDDLDQPEG